MSNQRVYLRAIIVFVVTFGLRLYAQPAPDLSKVSTDVLRHRLEEIHQKKTVIRGGLYGRFVIEGEISANYGNEIFVFGQALPLMGDPSVRGTHISRSCLRIKEPTHGKVVFDHFFSGPEEPKRLYYIGEGTAQNSFGATIPCSLYGNAPEKVRIPFNKLTNEANLIAEELRGRGEEVTFFEP